MESCETAAQLVGVGAKSLARSYFLGVKPTYRDVHLLRFGEGNLQIVIL